MDNSMDDVLANMMNKIKIGTKKKHDVDDVLSSLFRRQTYITKSKTSTKKSAKKSKKSVNTPSKKSTKPSKKRTEKMSVDPTRSSSRTRRAPVRYTDKK